MSSRPDPLRGVAALMLLRLEPVAPGHPNEPPPHGVRICTARGVVYCRAADTQEIRAAILAAQTIVKARESAKRA